MKPTIQLSLSIQKHLEKPPQTEIAKLKWEASKMTLVDFAKAIESGHSFCPVVFKDNRRSNNNFLQSNIFALDFDNNENPNDIIELFKKNGIHVNLWYKTFSWKPNFRKFRIIIAFDETFTNRILRFRIQSGLIKFTNSDRHCKDAARLFFAGKDPVVLHENLNPWDNVKTIQFIDSIIKEEYSKKIASITKTHIKQMKPLLTDAQIPKKLIENFNWDLACSRSTVLNGFLHGKVHLKYAQLLALVTNALYIKGGMRKVKAAMDLNSPTQYKPEDYNLVDIATAYKGRYAAYNPAEIKNFDPFLEGKFKNILTLGQGERIIVHHKPEELPVNEVARSLEKAWKQILKGKSSKIQIIQTSTGVGKTQILADFISQKLIKDVIIAFSTHKLKNEFARRLLMNNFKDFVRTPEIPTFSVDAWNNEISSLFTHLHFKRASARILSIQTDKRATQDDINASYSYMEKLRTCRTSPFPVLTTHKAMMNCFQGWRSFKHSKVIFDEDILESLMPVETMTEKDILDLWGSTRKCSKPLRKKVDVYLDQIMENMDSKEQHAILSLKGAQGLLKHEEELLKATKGAKFVSLLRSKVLVRSLFYTGQNKVASFTVYGSRPVKLPKKYNITILSATIDPWFYENLYPNVSLNFITTPKAQNLSPVVQYTSNTFSKKSLKRNRNSLEGIKLPNTGEDIILTYKNLKDLFPKADKDLHFGNLSGRDKHKGHNLSVIGTPLPNTGTTISYASLFQLPVLTDFSKVNRRISLHKGAHHIEFTAYTYRDDTLAQIEVRWCSMQLEQAIGRARTTRTDAIVTCYSAIPAFGIVDIYNPQLKGRNEDIGDISGGMSNKDNE